MRMVIAAIAAALIAFNVPSAHAQNYPNRPIRLIVPFAAGGAVDVLARLLGGKVSDQLGQPVIVENRPGAGAVLDHDRLAELVGQLACEQPRQHVHRAPRRERHDQPDRAIGVVLGMGERRAKQGDQRDQ